MQVTLAGKISSPETEIIIDIRIKKLNCFTEFFKMEDISGGPRF